MIICRVCKQPRKPAYKGSARCGPCRNEVRRADHKAWIRQKKQAAAWNRAHPERTRASNRAYAARVRKNNPALAMWRGAKARAAIKGLPFSIEVSDICIPSHCPVFGFEIALSDGTHQDSSPSLDRIIPEKGYVPGNIAVISYLANQIKQAGTATQHRQVADWMDRVTKEAAG